MLAFYRGNYTDNDKRDLYSALYAGYIAICPDRENPRRKCNICPCKLVCDDICRVLAYINDDLRKTNEENSRK